MLLLFEDVQSPETESKAQQRKITVQNKAPALQIKLSDRQKQLPVELTHAANALSSGWSL
jgi:hypothetical protein